MLRLPALLVFLLGCAPSPPAAGEPPVGVPAAASPVAPVAPTPAPPRPPLVVDLHVDTVTMMLRERVPWTDGSLEASLPRLREAGVNVVVQAAWVPRGVKDPRAVALGKLRAIRAMVAQEAEHAAIVTGPEQLDRVVREGRIAVLLGLEGGTALTDGVATLDEMRELGLSVVGLTWTESSPYADSSAEPRAGAAGGLTASGRELVAACNDRGLILDVSHMSDRATAQTVQLSRAPVIASHSNARWVADVPRNLPLELARAIAERGGLVGAMFHGPFVKTGAGATRADVVGQLVALIEQLGAEHVAIGSDFDGIISEPEDLTTIAGLPLVFEELQAAGVPPEGVRQVAGENFGRLWNAVWAAKAP